MARRSKADARTAVGYLRASTSSQDLSPAAQQAAIESWAARAGVTVTSWHSDLGVSGGAEIEDRPGLLAAIAALRDRRAGLFVIARRDRLARDAYVAAAIERAVRAADASIISADGVANGQTAADGFLRTILDGAAAFERSQIRARTKAALAAKRARGERIGALPFGYELAKDGRTLLPNQREQDAISSVRALRAAGLSIRQIVGECARSGINSRSGKPLGKSQVERIIGPAKEPSAAERPAEPQPA